MKPTQLAFVHTIYIYTLTYLLTYLCVVTRSSGRGDSQQDQSHWKDGSCVPGTTVSASIILK